MTATVDAADGRRLEIDGAALREEIAAAYGIELPADLFRGEASDAGRVLLADRLASAISGVGARAAPASPDRPGTTPSDWTPLPTAPPRPGDPALATARLLAWARDGGVEVDALEIRTRPDGYRTVHAGRHLTAGERLLHVPRGLLFALEQVQRTPICEAIADLPLASEYTLLAVALVAERHDPGSRWRPYLDALPDRFPGMPVFQDAPALAPLAGSSILGDVVRRRRAVQVDHATVAPRLKPHLDLDLAELAWAHAVCASRAFSTKIEGLAGSALIPIADCCDHGPGDVHYRCDDAAGGMEITAARDLASGDEIHLSYGRKSNARLLAGYGFCLSDNPADVARMVLPRHELDVRGELIARVLWGRPLGAPWEVQISKDFDDDTRLALSHARLAVATERERMIALDRGYLRQRGVRWISERNEAAACAALAAAAGARLAAIPMVPGDATPYARAVTLLLRGERQVLIDAIEFLAEVSRLLPGATRWDFQRIGDAAGDRLLGQYLRQVATELP